MSAVMGGGKCLRPDCKRAAKNRGLCHSCRLVLARLLKDGKVTEAALVAAGKLLPKHSQRVSVLAAQWFLEPATPKAATQSRVHDGRLPQDPTPAEIAARKSEVLAARGRR